MRVLTQTLPTPIIHGILMETPIPPLLLEP
jgi:hypothetical protein